MKPSERMTPSEVLRRAKGRKGPNSKDWSISFEDPEASRIAIKFLAKVNYDIDRAIELAEAEELRKLHHVLELNDGTFHCSDCGNLVTHHNLDAMIAEEREFEVEAE